jgi:1,4-alpha-glucan branching enzyme
VLLYAPDASYGRPEELKALVDAAAHARGLMVLLDVVYNHFGPEGSFVKAIAPQFFTDRRKSPWGEAINMDGEGPGPVREYFIHNALYWIISFRWAALRCCARDPGRFPEAPVGGAGRAGSLVTPAACRA